MNESTKSQGHIPWTLVDCNPESMPLPTNRLDWGVYDSFLILTKHLQNLVLTLLRCAIEEKAHIALTIARRRSCGL